MYGAALGARHCLREVPASQLRESRNAVFGGRLGEDDDGDDASAEAPRAIAEKRTRRLPPGDNSRRDEHGASFGAKKKRC